MTDKDIIIIYVKQFTINTEEFMGFEDYTKKVNEDENTKIIVVPNEIVEVIERL